MKDPEEGIIPITYGRRGQGSLPGKNTNSQSHVPLKTGESRASITLSVKARAKKSMISRNFPRSIVYQSPVYLEVVLSRSSEG